MTPPNQDSGLQFDPVDLTWDTAPKPTKKRGRRLSAIIRVSQRKGREGDSFMSPDQQRELILATALRNGDLIVNWHDETDSVSGGKLDRVGLKGALWEVRQGISDGVIVAKVNRFARIERAGRNLIYDLVEAGHIFIAAANNIDTANFDRGQQVYLDFLLRQAQWEREDLIANWLDVRHRHVANGVAVKACYGYTKGKDRKLVKVPAEARWVVRIFKWRAAGKSWSWIAKELNRLKVPPPQTDSKRVNPSVMWVPQHVTAVVNRRTYLGELRRGDAVNIGAHKAIITMDLWEDAHAVKVADDPEKAEDNFFMLASLVRCGGCGGRMTGDTQTNGTGTLKHRYYRCRKQYPWGRCKTGCMVPADELEAFVIADFERRMVRKVKGKGRRQEADLAKAIAKVDQARAELREFNRATKAAREELGDEDFREGLDERTEAVRAAREEEQAARAIAMGIDLPADLVDDWKTMGEGERAVLIGRFYHCIAVRPKERAWAPEATKDRVRLWLVGDRDAPKDLPGRPIGRRVGPKKKSKLRPITWS